MKAFHKDIDLQKVKHDVGINHIVEYMQSDAGPGYIVPIVVHFDEHEDSMNQRKETHNDDSGKAHFLSMLRL